MNQINNRVTKLESRLAPNTPAPVIRYICRAKDGEQGSKDARFNAIVEWEKENGPLGGVEPNFIERSIVEPQ
jgi:hypothetical protein